MRQWYHQRCSRLDIESRFNENAGYWREGEVSRLSKRCYRLLCMLAVDVYVELGVGGEPFGATSAGESLGGLFQSKMASQ